MVPSAMATPMPAVAVAPSRRQISLSTLNPLVPPCTSEPAAACHNTSGILGTRDVPLSVPSMTLLTLHSHAVSPTRFVLPSATQSLSSLAPHISLPCNPCIHQVHLSDEEDNAGAAVGPVTAPVPEASPGPAAHALGGIFVEGRPRRMRRGGIGGGGQDASASLRPILDAKLQPPLPRSGVITGATLGQRGDQVLEGVKGGSEGPSPATAVPPAASRGLFGSSQTSRLLLLVPLLLAVFGTFLALRTSPLLSHPFSAALAPGGGGRMAGGSHHLGLGMAAAAAAAAAASSPPATRQPSDVGSGGASVPWSGQGDGGWNPDASVRIVAVVPRWAAFSHGFIVPTLCYHLLWSRFCVF